MNNILIYLLEASVCLGVFYLFYGMVLHNQTSYQYNRFYLLLAPFLSFVLPLLKIPISFSNGASAIKGSAEGYILLNPVGIDQAGAALQSVSFSEVIIVVYAAGAGLALFFFLKQLFQLSGIIRRHKHFAKEEYILVYTEGKLSASSFFRYLFWDNTQQLDFYEQQQIMTHEEAHIRHRHSYDIVYMALLKIVFWFHPLVYLYEKALIETHEYIADAQVLQRTHLTEYACLLTKSLFDHLELSLVNHFYKSRTLKRIEMMHLKNQKTPWYKLVLAVPVLLTVFFVFSCQPDEEELEKKAIAASYDNTQSEMKQLSEQQLAIINKYYPKMEKFRDAVEEKGNDIEALKAANISDKDMATYEKLITARENLQEQLAELPDADNIFMVVEDQPEPEGGMEKFYNYVGNNLQYPTEARQNGIEGRVFIQFVVNEDGSLTDVQAIKGIGSGCDAEAARVIKEAPAWNPGKQKGIAVKVKWCFLLLLNLMADRPIR